MFGIKRKLGTTKASLMKIAPLKLDAKKKPAAAGGGDKRVYVLPKARFIREEILCKDAKDVADMLCVYGVAILPGVVSPKECDAHFDAVARDMETIVPTFKYDTPSTWQNLRRHGHAIHTMLFQNLGVPWLPSIVKIRQNPEFARIFAELWSELDAKNTYRASDMLMSADGIAFHLNRSDFAHGFHREGHDWLHADKAPSDNVTSVQSFLNLCDTRRAAAPSDNVTSSTQSFLDIIRGRADVHRNGCLEVILRSHNFRKEFGERFPSRKDVGFNLIENQEQLDFFLVEKKCEMAFVDAKKGDIVFWGSATWHQGKAAEKQPHSDVIAPAVFKRLAVYVSMQPRSYATPKDIEKKRKAFEELRATHHPAARHVELFPLLPRTYGQPLVAQPLAAHPELDEQGRRQWAITHGPPPPSSFFNKKQKK